MSLYSRFAQHHDALQTLDLTLRQKISELVFSCRDGVLSVCVVFPDVMYLRSLIASVPSQVEQATGKRFAVDLESIGTDRLRLYIDGQDDDEVIRGFYFDANLQMSVLKKYNRSDDPLSVSIDRYAARDHLIHG